MTISEEAKQKLIQQPWKGNVRELENTMARAVALADTDILLADDIPLSKSIEAASNIEQAASVLNMSPVELKAALDQFHSK